MPKTFLKWPSLLIFLCTDVMPSLMIKWPNHKWSGPITLCKIAANSLHLAHSTILSGIRFERLSRPSLFLANVWQGLPCFFFKSLLLSAPSPELVTITKTVSRRGRKTFHIKKPLLNIRNWINNRMARRPWQRRRFYAWAYLLMIKRGNPDKSIRMYSVALRGGASPLLA